MRLRREKPEPVRGREPRTADRSSAPAFSYYNNRPADVSGRRSPGRQASAVSPVRPQKNLSRFSLGQLPFWLLVAAVVVFIIKLLLLSPSPKVIVLGGTPTTNLYRHSNETYATAAGKVLAGSIMNRTKLTADVGSMATSLEHEFPELQTASVTLPLMGNRPIVYVLVAQPSLVLQTAHGNFAVNKTGLVLAKLSSLPADIPAVLDQTGVVPKEGAQFLPSSTVSFVRAVAYQFAVAKLAVVNYVLPAASPYELDAHLEGKPYAIRFNLQNDALQQSGAAIATLQRLGSSTPGSYLDVRVPGRVYYK